MVCETAPGTRPVQGFTPRPGLQSRAPPAMQVIPALNLRLLLDWGKHWWCGAQWENFLRLQKFQPCAELQVPRGRRSLGMPALSRESYLLPMALTRCDLPSMGVFLIALGNPGLEGAARQEGTCDGLCRMMGWHPQGSCHSSDLHRTVIHTELCLPRSVSHPDLLFFYPPGYSPILGKGKRHLQPSCVLLLPLCTRTGGVAECPTCLLAPPAAV